MISAVVPPRPIAQPQLPPKAPPPAPMSVRDRAAAGYFRDLALWLNEPLVNQGIFVQVQADDRPGCLKLTVEFERAPIQDRLTRFLCHRVWQLNSELIEGIYVVARPVGWQRVLWKQRIKISTPALRRRQTSDQLTQTATPAGSPLPPSLRSPRRRNRSVASPRSSQGFKTLRTFMLTGSAVAAFVLGCLLEVMVSGASPSLPSFSAQAPEDRHRLAQTDGGNLVPAPALEDGQGNAARLASPSLPPIGGSLATPVNRSSTATAAPAEFPRPPRASGSAPRPSVVDTTLEPVAVIPHDKPSPVPADEVTLLFGGDVSLDNLNVEQLEAEGGFFAEVEEYFNADVSLVNLATPLANAATSLDEEFHQRTRPEAAQLLANSGVDIVNLTHSNLMQYGAEGLSETLTALDSNGLYRVGAGRNATEARRPEILDVKGKRIAYLSYAMGGNDAAIDTSALRERAGAENEIVARELENFKQSTAFQERAGFNAQNMPEIVQDIQAIRDQVDWIVVNFRWVDHLEETPNFVQTNLARLAIDQGADVVVGYHPTVIQGGEVYKGRPIAYSLGDFVFTPDQPLQDQDSAMLKVSLHEEQMQVEFVPVRIRDSRPTTLSGEAGQGVLQRIQAASAQFDTPLQPSVVLDLSAPAQPPAETLDPDSPFVSPEADDTLILDPAPPEAETQPPGDETIDKQEGNTNDAEIEDKGPEDRETEDGKPEDGETPSDLDPAAADDLAPNPNTGDTLDLPLPGNGPVLDLQQQFDQELPEWGPKVAPKEQEFRPVPQNRSGAEDPNLAAQADLDLLQRLVDTLRPNRSNPSPTEESWTDQVPAVPTPTGAMEVNPAPLAPAPAAEKATPAQNSAAHPPESAPSSVVAPAAVSAPVTEVPLAQEMAPALEVMVPAQPSPVPNGVVEVMEVAPESASTTTPDKDEDAAEEDALTPAEAKQAFPDTKVIPPHAEPLVGPLGFAEDGVDLDAEVVTLGQAELSQTELSQAELSPAETASPPDVAVSLANRREAPRSPEGERRDESQGR